jgi:tRNA threonylcarbamoyl adenosine modification protein (Sua5/YciO/YrdC/YwlC family)
MTLLRLEIDPQRIEPRKIARAVSMLHEGCVAGYPTDTMYALGCAIEARRAVDRIARARRLDPKARLALICPDLSTAATFAHFDNAAFRVARRLLPGPYTLVLPATREVPRTLLDQRRRTVGIRVPDHPVLLAILKRLGRPLLTTSAIPPGADAACSDADAVEVAFGSSIDLLVDGGPTGDLPSTVIEVAGDGITVLRAGLGPVDDLGG